jgi:hypothetical protein
MINIPKRTEKETKSLTKVTQNGKKTKIYNNVTFQICLQKLPKQKIEKIAQNKS